MFVVDITPRMLRKEVAWCGVCDCVEFDGVPFIVIGRQIMQCCYGRGRRTGDADDDMSTFFVVCCIITVFCLSL